MLCVSILCHSQSWWSVKICNCFMKLNYGDMNNLSVEEATKPPCQSLRCPGVAERGRNHTCPSMRKEKKSLLRRFFPKRLLSDRKAESVNPPRPRSSLVQTGKLLRRSEGLIGRVSLRGSKESMKI